MSLCFPFSAIVDQSEMKLALLSTAVDPSIGGVLIFGDRGTGKSTAVRALAALLPPMAAVTGCRYQCDVSGDALCADCRARPTNSKSKLKTRRVAVPVVDLPLGASEDRVIGALDLERALNEGVKAFEPGLLARANRGYLYVDEVNLLEDHLVDILIDVAASGENVVEREGLSVRHPARFVLVGSGNPEEGDLRPQLLDRFGLCVEVKTPADLKARVEVMRRRDEFEMDPMRFVSKWRSEDLRFRRKILAARGRCKKIVVPERTLERVASLCMRLGTDGLRGELTILRAARALAALDNAREVGDRHVREVAPAALRHRLRRSPLDEASATDRVARALAEEFGTT